MSRTISRRTVSARRGRHDGAAVARVASAWARTVAVRSGTPRVSEALCRAVHGQRHQRQSLVGPRQRRRDEAEQVAAAARAVEEEDQRHQRPVQQAGRRHGHPPGTDRQPAVGRADPEGRHRQGRDHDGSGARQSHRPGDAAIEHRAGVRAADDRLSRDEFLDGLQLAHLVAERRFAGAERGLSVARVRQPVRESRQPALSEHPRSREGPRGHAEPAGERDRQGQARRVPDQRARSREAHRAHARGEGRGRRTGQAQEPPGVRDGSSAERPAGGSARAHAADVRHHRARVPDRQDARGVAAAGARPVVALLSRSSMCATAITARRTTICPTATSGSRASI